MQTDDIKRAGWFVCTQVESKDEFKITKWSTASPTYDFFHKHNLEDRADKELQEV